jgi:hypothetical protein
MEMKFSTKLVIPALLLYVLLPTHSQAKGSNDPEKVISHKYELVVDVTPQKAWKILANYANVGDFHGGVQSSYGIGTKTQGVGGDRFCQIDAKVTVKERVSTWKEGEYYIYDVYEWENFPLKKMYNSFGVKVNDQGQTVIYSTINYRLKNGLIELMAKGKLKYSARDGLLWYKDYMETGVKNRNLKELRKIYKAF